MKYIKLLLELLVLPVLEELLVLLLLTAELPELLLPLLDEELLSYEDELLVGEFVLLVVVPDCELPERYDSTEVELLL